MTAKLESAINESKLEYGEAVISEYSGLSEQDKEKMLENYADNVLNTIIYHITCEVMHDNNDWVARVISTYKQYCDNILMQDSGINASLNYIYLTHAFEGDVRKDIETFCDGMVAQAGFYGEFALTCAGQDSLQTTDTKEEIREYFVNTVLNLSERKNKSITSHDNYCYITGTIVQESVSKFTSNIYIYRDNYDLYEGCDVHNWDISCPAIINSVYLPVIYRYYANFHSEEGSFINYLADLGVNSDRNDKSYLTKYNNPETFPFSEGIYMKALRFVNGGDYFNDGSWYHIDVGTGGDVEQEYYHVHDKITGDLFDTSNGAQNINTIVAARALYGEGHDAWYHDECWLFLDDNYIFDFGPKTADDLNIFAYKNISVLESQQYHDVSGDAVNDPNNPFYAFDMVSIPQALDNIVYENLSTDITEVLLDSDSFTYTGQPIEPAVTVFASEDIVPEDGYKVTYLNNIEAGGYAVVRVEGIGDYSGVITRHFTITSSNNSPMDYYKSSGSGCNTIGGLGLALGLVFLFKKSRKR